MNGVSDSRDHASRIKNLIHHGRKRLLVFTSQRLQIMELEWRKYINVKIIRYNVSGLESSVLIFKTAFAILNEKGLTKKTDGPLIGKLGDIKVYGGFGLVKKKQSVNDKGFRLYKWLQCTSTVFNYSPTLETPHLSSLKANWIFIFLSLFSDTWTHHI